MLNNKFGSWKQMILIRVETPYRNQALEQLGLNTSGQEPNIIAWTRTTPHRGNCESIVADLALLLASIPESSWTVDWSRSSY